LELEIDFSCVVFLGYYNTYHFTVNQAMKYNISDDKLSNEVYMDVKSLRSETLASLCTSFDTSRLKAKVVYAKEDNFSSLSASDSPTKTNENKELL